MKKISLYSQLALLAIAISSGPVFSNADLLPGYPGWELASYDQYLAQGLEALHDQNLVEAKQHFVTAKRYADNSHQRKFVKRLIKKLRYFEDYYYQVNRAEEYLAVNDPVAALSCYAKADRILKESAEKQVAPDLDNEFLMQTRLLIKQTDDKRILDYKAFVSEGRQYLAYDQPEAALTAFRNAKNIMYKEDIDQTKINNLIDESERKGDYKIYIAKGKAALEASNLTEARDWFLKAKDRHETADVNRLIDHSEQLLSDRYLEEGREAFSDDRYETALASFDQALSLRETPEIKHWRDLAQHKLYLQLVEQAEAAFLDRKYEDALQLYEDAREVKETEEVAHLIDSARERIYEAYLLKGTEAMERRQYEQAGASFSKAKEYKVTPEIEEFVAEAENGMKYAEAFKEAREEIQQGSKEKAFAAFEKARSYMDTEEVRAELRELSALFDLYDEKVKAGDLALENDDLQKALDFYEEAGDLIDKEEIRSRIETVSLKINGYNDYLKRGKDAYENDNAEPALSNFRKAKEYRSTEEIDHWIDRARRMPCTIKVLASGHENHIEKSQLELVDFYTLNVLYTVPLTSGGYTFPKVEGGDEKKYYIRAYKRGRRDEGKIPLVEKICDCSGNQRMYEVELYFE